MVQEACTNALRHGDPTRVTILGYLGPGLIKLTVQDNGSGFDSKEMLNLDALQANKHFGLSGMFERAELIGAEIRIESEPATGTSVRIIWKPSRE
jgi:two-component system sensor histidine kinase DegS